MLDPVAENRARIEDFRRTRNLLALWPDVTPEGLHAAHAQLRTATEGILRGVTAAPSLIAEDADQVRALGIAAFMGGMGPLLGSWIAAGQLAAPPSVRALFARHLDHGRRRAAALHARLSSIVARLRDEGIDPVVLKGMHTGAVFFPEPGTRPASDIDLLVLPAELERARGVLARSGLVERRRTAWAARSEWEPIGASRDVLALDMEHVEDPWSVDLHAGLDRWYFRGVRRGLGADAFERTDEIRIGEAIIRVLSQPQLATFLALHASQEIVKVRLVRLVELAWVIGGDRSGARLDWEEMMQIVRKHDIARFVQPAIVLAASLVPGILPHAVQEELDAAATPRMRRVIRAVSRAELAPLSQRSLDSKLMWASGPLQLALNVSELIVPSDDGEAESLLVLYRERVRAVWRGTVRWRAGAPRP